MPPEREPITRFGHATEGIRSGFFFPTSSRVRSARVSPLARLVTSPREKRRARSGFPAHIDRKSSAFLSPFVVFRGAYVYARAFARRMNNQNYITFAVNIIITSTRTPRAPPACPRARRTPRTARVLTPQSAPLDLVSKTRRLSPRTRRRRTPPPP